MKKLIYLAPLVLIPLFIYLVLTIPHRDRSRVTIPLPPAKPYIPPPPENVIDEVNRNAGVEP